MTHSYLELWSQDIKILHDISKITLFFRCGPLLGSSSEGHYVFMESRLKNYHVKSTLSELPVIQAHKFCINIEPMLIQCQVKSLLI